MTKEQDKKVESGKKYECQKCGIEMSIFSDINLTRKMLICSGCKK